MNLHFFAPRSIDVETECKVSTIRLARADNASFFPLKHLLADGAVEEGVAIGFADQGELATVRHLQLILANVCRCSRSGADVHVEMALEDEKKNGIVGNDEGVIVVDVRIVTENPTPIGAKERIGNVRFGKMFVAFVVHALTDWFAVRHSLGASASAICSGRAPWGIRATVMEHVGLHQAA